jgi:hypothetical protein
MVTLRVERLEKDFEAMAELVAQKAEKVEITHLDEQVRSMTDVLVRAQRVVDLQPDQLKTAFDEAEARSRRRLQDLEEGTLQQLRLAQDRLGDQMREMREVLSTKAEGESTVCEHLNTQHRVLSTALSQKAEWSEVEQLRIQFGALRGNVAQQAEAQAAETESLTSKMQAAVASAGAQQGVREELRTLSAALQMKAEQSRVETLVQQLTTLSDIVSTKLTSRPQCRRPASRPGY